MSIHCCNTLECQREDESEISAADDETERQRKCLKREDNITVQDILRDYGQDILELVTSWQQLLGLSTFDSSMMYADIEEGRRGPMLGLLLVLLPNLEAIAHEGYSWSASWSYTPLLRHIVSAYEGTHWSSKPLAKLVEVGIYRGNTPEVGDDESVDDDECELFELFAPFTALPSVRILRGDHLTLTDPISWTNRGRNASAITEIGFQNSAIAPDLLFNLLGWVTCLQKFTYSYNRVVDPDDIAGSDEIIVSLLDHARHSLEYLSLVGGPIDCDEEGESNISTAALRQFSALRELHITLSTWPGDIVKTESTADDDDYRYTLYAFVEVLPPSIETVEIATLYAIEQFDDLLANFVEKKSEALPNLKLTSCFWEQHQAHTRPHVRACSTVGVTLRLFKA